MSAGNKDLGAVAHLADFNDVDLYLVALFKNLGGNSLAGLKDGLGVVRARIDAEANGAALVINVGNCAGEDLVLLGGELLVDHAALCFAYALDDNALGGLSGDTAELLGIDGDVYDVAHLGALGIALRLLGKKLDGGVLDGLNYRLADIHIYLVLGFVNVDENVFLRSGVILADSG